MTTVIAMSVVSVAACLVTLHRVFGLAIILKYATLVDVAFTLVLAAFLAGTLTGSLVAVLGGLIMALVLTLMKFLVRVAGRVPAGPLARRSTDIPAGVDPSEYNEAGVWIYNTAPYV